MYTDSEGIVLRQTKTLNGRRMIEVFTRRYGKISAGTSISEKGRTKSALALRPFTLGNYDIFKGRDSFSIQGAEVLQSYYEIGEDIDKYMAASYVLELTEKLIEEEMPEPAHFNLLKDFLEQLSKRRQAYETLVIAYVLKSLILAGCAPNLDACACCGSSEAPAAFSVKDGGFVCPVCYEKQNHLDPLSYPVDAGVVSALRFMQSHPLKSLEGIGLEPGNEDLLRRIFKSYLSYHMSIEHLNSEGLRI